MKELINRIGVFIQKILKNVYTLAEENAAKAVIATQVINDWVDLHGGTLRDLASHTNTRKDDVVLDIILSHLPKISKKILLADGFISETTDEMDAADKLLRILRTNQKEGRVKYWIILAAEFLMAIVNRRFPFNAAILITQQSYTRLFAKEE